MSFLSSSSSSSFDLSVYVGYLIEIFELIVSFFQKLFGTSDDDEDESE